MSAHIDPRIAELETLAAEEGLRLPYPPDYICWLEDRGRMVDLQSGEVIYSRIVAAPTLSARAIVHLLAGAEGEIFITS